MDGMDDQGPVVAGDETGGLHRPPPRHTLARPPEWSVPSPRVVPAPAIAAPAFAPLPPPVRRNPNRLTAALVVALVVAMATAAWAAFDRLDIHLSRPTLSSSPSPK